MKMKVIKFTCEIVDHSTMFRIFTPLTVLTLENLESLFNI